MKSSVCIFFLVACLSGTYAQKVDYKKGIITLDGQDWAKMTVQKQNFGLTKSFEVFSLADEKLIIAAPAMEFEKDKSDNSVMYYRLTFLTSNQVGIFKLSALGQEKSFLKLLALSGIIVNDKTDDAKVKEFIAMKSASPAIAVNYTIVSRDRMWPVRLQEDKNIEQQGKIIGSFKPTGSMNETSQYEFLLPSGVVIAKVSFTGGNNAQNFELFTSKDNQKRVIPIPHKEKVIATGTGIDKYWVTLDRIAKWLVDNLYL